MTEPPATISEPVYPPFKGKTDCYVSAFERHAVAEDISESATAEPGILVRSAAWPALPIPSSRRLLTRAAASRPHRERAPGQAGPLAEVVTGLGHVVVARETEVADVAAVTAREHPDVALVGLGLSSEHALDLIDRIVSESSCPVIALLTAEDPHGVARRPSAACSPTSSTPTLPSS